MNENISPSLLSCPNCGWSEADEQAFLEQQQNAPAPALWRRILRRIDNNILISDLYYFVAIMVLCTAFSHTFALYKTDVVFPYIHRLVLAAVITAPVLFCRFLYGKLMNYMITKELS